MERPVLLKDRARSLVGKGNYADAEVAYYDLIEILNRAKPGRELGEAFNELAVVLKAQKKDYSPFLVLAEKLLRE